MQEVYLQLNHLRNSINQNCKDFSQLVAIEKKVMSISLEEINPKAYTQLIFTMYDISNHHNLIKLQSSTNDQAIISHQLSLRLKVQSVKMVCLLLNMINQSKVIIQNAHQVEREAFEMMVLSIRLFLESEESSISFGTIHEFQSYCDILYEYEKNEVNMNQQIATLYYINKLDTLRINVESHKFSDKQFLKYLHEWEKQEKNQAGKSKNTRQYIEFIVTEVCLKILRKKDDCPDTISEFLRYLPENLREPMINILEGHNLNPETLEILGPDYQLYWQIKSSGLQNISQEYLETIISQMFESNNNSIFQIALLTDQPSLVLLWFAISNKSTKKAANLTKGIQCFIGLLQKVMDIDQVSFTRQSYKKFGTLVDLSRQVCLNMLRIPKNQNQTDIPMQTFLLMASQFLVFLLTTVYNNFRSVDELFENVYLVANKHEYLHICKTVSSLHLYYQMLHQTDLEYGPQKTGETYRKFIKHHSHDNSQNSRLLKAAYLLLHNHSQPIDQETVQTLKMKPEFAVIFLQKANKLLLLLDIPMEEFIQLGNCFDIYCQILNFVIGTSVDPNSIHKTLQHFQKFCQTVPFKKLYCTNGTFVKLKEIIEPQIFEQGAPQRINYCLIWLFVFCFEKDWQRIRDHSYGQAFNRFSKLMKMLTLVQTDLNAFRVMKILVCIYCQKSKKMLVERGEKDKKDTENEAGEILFLKSLYEKILKFERENENLGSDIEFIKFSMFQLYCINNREADIEEFFDHNNDIKIQKLCLSSVYIPKPFKRMILRKLFKNNLSENSYPSISLEQIKDLIELSETNAQTKLYIQSAIDIFGQKGRMYLELLAQQNRKVQQLLMNLNLRDQ